MNAAPLTWDLDHVAVVAETLDEGADWIEERLGVRPVPGGRHETMGTHNCLLSLGPRLYLEVISIDPDAPPPGRPRWFGLDDVSGPPRLQAWMVRTSNLDAALRVAPEGSGEPIEFARGDYRWRMAVPRGGASLPFGGVAPALIEWHGDLHPADALPPSDVQLASLTVTHPEPLAQHLPPLERVHYVSGAPGLSAVFDTRAGERQL